MSRFFINRPIFASVISIIIVIAGLMAARALPIAQYPEITPPTVVITASYPGASADTLAKTVAAPSRSSSRASRTCSTSTPAPRPTAA